MMIFDQDWPTGLTILAVNFIYIFMTYLPKFSVADWILIQSRDRTHTDLERMQVEAIVA